MKIIEAAAAAAARSAKDACGRKQSTNFCGGNRSFFDL